MKGLTSIYTDIHHRATTKTHTRDTAHKDRSTRARRKHVYTCPRTCSRIHMRTRKKNTHKGYVHANEDTRSKGDTYMCMGTNSNINRESTYTYAHEKNTQDTYTRTHMHTYGQTHSHVHEQSRTRTHRHKRKTRIQTYASQN